MGRETERGGVLMQFSVIYSVDNYRWKNLRGFIPFGKAWTRTESKPDEEGVQAHGKWRAVLTKEQFCRFVEKFYLTASTIGTLGSLGAPGCGLGIVPAISFDYDSSNDGGRVWANAYVTPLLCRKDGTPIRKNGCNERDWKRVKRIICCKFR